MPLPPPPRTPPRARDGRARDRSEPRAEAPAGPERSDLRASDAERDRTVEALRAHSGAGRLDSDELEDRIGKALAARTRADLAALVEDLPEPRRAAAPPRQRHERRRHGKDPFAFVPIALLLIAIWAVTGAGYFWPMWPLMWFAFASLGGVLRSGNTHVTR